MENSYYVYTINALSLINSIKNRSKNRRDGFVVDLTDIIPAYVTMELRDDNALFYQIRRLYSDPDEIGYDQNALKDKIIIVDFKSTFEQMHYENYNITSALKKIKNDNNPLSWGNLISRMLDSDEGISVIFSDHPESSVTFLPFDKSASMAKASRISYIAKDIWNDLDERMRLGIDFSKIKVSLSKYYAYRGLYLTSGTRIDQTDEFQLNEETVIVLPDCKLTPTGDYEEKRPMIYAQKNGEKSGKSYYEFEVRYEEIKSNIFDGEGLITPQFAECIRKQLNNSATSFQVRMPFIKGMLHEVDFHKIISDECNIEITEDLKIRDFLGEERSLKTAQIIINESMFKCHAWLRDYWGKVKKPFKAKYKEDPMNFFFSKMEDYNHSMYISGSNATFYPSGKERLNYQFLSTLKLSGEDISILVDQHFTNAKAELKKYLQPGDAKSKKSKPFIAAAIKNPAFYKEERLIADARQQVKNIRYDCGMGSLLTSGEHRYLSADLLLYIWHILSQVIIQEDSKQDMDNIINKLRRKCLSEKFYMPGAAMDGFNYRKNKDKAYALFRSPHLSRNEEFLMRAYHPSARNDIYNKYFSKLTGLIMTPVTSLVCECLGGADKDGDIVKIISDEIITNAVNQGGYINNKRILPIVNIPTSKAKEKKPTNPTEFKLLIVNTFSSYTGQISNMAITFAYDEYCDSNTNTDPENSLCANATAIVGLTIDAGKNGGHPLRNIKELKRKAKEKDYKGRKYIDFKDTMKRLRGYNYTKVKLNKDNPAEEYYYLERSSWSEEIKIQKPDANDHVLQYLPYLFAQKDHESDDIQYLKENNLLPECQPSTSQFAFEKKDYTENLTETGIKETKKLIKEYLNLNKDLRRFRIYASRGMNSYGKLITLLRIKYDSLDEILCSCPKDEGNVQISITDALDDAIYYFRSYLDQEDKANAALNALNKKNSLWLFCPKDDRISYICNIIGCNDPADIPEQVKALVTDFSFDGFYILYYIFELIYSSLIDDRSEQEKLEYWLEKNRDQEEGQYYERLLKKYKETYYISKSADQYSSENGETSNDEDSEQIEYIGWRQAVNTEAYDILLEISKDNNKNKEKPDKLIALEYAFYARKEADPRGTFFWDVLNRDLILDNINKVNRNA